MDGNTARQQIRAQIQALRQARDSSDDATVQAAANEAIESLEAQLDALLVADMDDFAAAVAQAAAALDEVRTRYGLDAASALGRTAGRLRAAAEAA